MAMTSANADFTARPYMQDPSAADLSGPRPRGHATATRDELDDLFNYDAEIGDALQNVNGHNDASARQDARRRHNELDAGLGLGIDEEIKVRKPRAPIAKLDEERLLSANGIPKLRRITKDRLKFRGKGHEFSDVSRLLNTYQLWLDDLFPKARFADGLAIIEKVGHKKRMQVMRREWIDEGKPRPASEEPAELDGDFVDRDQGVVVLATDGVAKSPDRTETTPMVEDPKDDEMARETTQSLPEDAEDLRVKPGREAVVLLGSTGEDSVAAGVGGHEPEMDELDMLMAEDSARPERQKTFQQAARTPDDNDFDDEMEAMAGLDDMW